MSDIIIKVSLSQSITIGGSNNNSGNPGPEIDPTVPSHVKSISTGDIASWNNKADGSALAAEEAARETGDLTQ